MLYLIFRNYTYSYLYLEGLMNGYSDAIVSGFTSTREYIEGIIGDFVSSIHAGNFTQDFWIWQMSQKIPFCTSKS